MCTDFINPTLKLVICNCLLFLYFSGPNNMKLLIQNSIYAEEVLGEIQPTPALWLKSSLIRKVEAQIVIWIMQLELGFPYVV